MKTRLYIYFIPVNRLEDFVRTYREYVYTKPGGIYSDKESRLLEFEKALESRGVPFYRVMLEQASLVRVYRDIVLKFEKHGYEHAYAYRELVQVCERHGVPASEFLPIFRDSSHWWSRFIESWVHYVINTTKIGNHVSKPDEVAVIATVVPYREADPEGVKSEWTWLIPLAPASVIVVLSILRLFVK